jgi:short-subunit dehydrogenase
MTVTRDGTGRTALVTGASAGIGMAFARILGERGFDLVITARRTGRLEHLANELESQSGITAHVMPADLARPDTARQLVQSLEQRRIAIDMLINNAGIGIAGQYRDISWDRHSEFIQLMVTAPCQLIHHLLPGMIRRGYGRIVNVSSVAGLIPGGARSSLYGASKAFLISFTQALHSEQRRTGVHLSALCPGFTRTEFHDVSGTREAMNRLPEFLWLDATKVAEEGYKAVMRNQPICVPGLQYKTIVGLSRLLPMGVAHRLVSRG